jgi:hypothetical protein
MTKKCLSNSCGRYFHDECAKTNKLFRKEVSATGSVKYLCPLHTCLTCWSETRIPATITTTDGNVKAEINETNSNLTHQSMAAFKGRFMKCVRCPTAYHVGDFCMAAGSVVLSGCNIICPNHFQLVKNTAQHARVNVTWCFVCCNNNDLIGCNKCPAAYHYKCIGSPPTDLNLPASKIQQLKDAVTASKRSLSPEPNKAMNASGDSCGLDQHSPTTSCNSVNSVNSVTVTNWTCEDCVQGKRLLYGQIVWAKVGE